MNVLRWKRTLAHIISNAVFDEDGSPRDPYSLEFVAQVAGLSCSDPNGKKRTIAESSVLGQMPEESRVVLKVFKYFDGP